MHNWLRFDRFLAERVRHHLTRTFIERPEELPRWLLPLIPHSKRLLLDGLRRIDASPYGRPQVSDLQLRTLTIGGQPRTDFATGCYLGLDFDLTHEDVEQVRRWGLRNGWSRASGVTPITQALEGELARRTGFDTCRIGPSISLINYSVFHALKTLFPAVLIDADAHMTLKRGVRAAYDARCVSQFPNNDLGALRQQLQALPSDLPKLVVVDGVYSMRGVRAPLRAILDLCREHGATCYIDDAHGFGILGEWGLGAAEGLTAEDRQHTVFVGGFSKSASNPVAFIAFPQHLWYGIDAADFLTFCGPPSNVHSVVALRHLRAFETGPYRERRRRVRESSLALHRLCAQSGIATFSEPGMPILSVRIPNDGMERIVAALDAHGIFAKIAIYPVVRLGEECIRFCLTAMHTDEQLHRLGQALAAVAPQCLQRPPVPAAPASSWSVSRVA
jgi:7-keto-8-aminopelargonate synthetase-like enzyme